MKEAMEKPLSNPHIIDELHEYKGNARFVFVYSPEPCKFVVEGKEYIGGVDLGKGRDYTVYRHR